MYNNGGVKTLSALKSLTAEAWEKVKTQLTPGMVFPGKIRVIETTDAAVHKGGVSSGYQIKKSGSDATAQVLTNGGLPIFRSTEYVADENAADILVKHENVLTGVVAQQAQAAGTLN